MSLSQYKKKRRFNETPEPQGKERSSKTSLRFVIQKHDASHLHYDFRLEMDGVLKSWAVPKGPSLNPADKRLAMMVEDHPYDYRTFEGVIPEGNYGAGTVIVWDEGFYENYEEKPMKKKDQEKAFLQELKNGMLKINLHGKKINGRYTLKKLKSDPSDNAWLLMKSNDKFATENEVTKKDKSVISGKTIAQVAKAHGTVPNHPEEKKSAAKNNKVKQPELLSTKKVRATSKTAAKKTATKKAATKKGSGAAKASKKKSPELSEILGEYGNDISKGSMFRNIKPMLATLVEEPFDSNDWIYEIKWDGYRSLAYIESKKVQLVSRNNISFTGNYSDVAEALKELTFSAVLDGEIVAINDKGVPDFQLLQNWQNSQNGQLQFYIFDVLWIEGYDVTSLPLIERKRILEAAIPNDHPVLRYSDHIEKDGKKFFDLALQQGLEGIMAKAAKSTYLINKRSKDWLKIKVNKRQEVVIGGYTSPRNSRQFFGALLLGVYQGEELVYIGHTGSGFNQKSLAEMHAKLSKLETNKSPFKKVPKANMPVTWVKPQLVCEIKFTEWTKDWIARHPIFMGLRKDKSPKDVHIEKSTNVTIQKEKVKTKKNKSGDDTPVSKKQDAGNQKLAKTSGVQLDIADGKDQLVTIAKQELKLTNLDKIYWKKEKCRKVDMLNYYLEIAPYMLPYMKDRPQSMHRHPNGIDGASFYQKDTKGKVPEWLQTHKSYSESNDEYIDYLVCRDEATLIYMANAGCIEMHPWHSRASEPDKPDWCLIDLDPEGIGFDKVIECAHVVKKVLDAIGAEAYPKTSGSTGIHIYIPLGAKYSYEQSKQLAEVAVTLVHQEIPSFTSLERSPSKRKNKIYLDYLQNRNTQTAASPYSLRPKPGVPVSTPLYWEEIKKGLTPTTYNINNIFDRLKTEGDIFRPVLGKGIDLQKVLSKIENL